MLLSTFVGSGTYISPPSSKVWLA